MAKFCQNCGTQIEDSQTFCPGCGAQQTAGATNAAAANPEAKSKIVAGILGILFGSIGVHNFYLGNTKRGIIQIIVTLFTFGLGGIWGFVEGILILVGNISTDANGVPLKD